MINIFSKYLISDINTNTLDMCYDVLNIIFSLATKSFTKIRLCSRWTNEWYLKESSKIKVIKLTTRNDWKLYKNAYSIQLLVVSSAGDKYVNDNLKHFGKVTEIDLTLCRNLRDEGLKHLKSVKKIYFKFSHITDKGLKYLKNVHTITFDYCDEITSEGLKYLKNAKVVNVNNCEKIK